jgi:hypoxanthine phosphoribosyltransferase
MEKLYKQINTYIKKNNITIDAVVPILRGGGFLGTYLTYKFRSLTILPIQYKYFFSDNNTAELRRISSSPKKNMFNKKNPVFLTVEGDQCFGNTVIHTIKDLKKMFPDCRIIHVADCLDYYYRDSVKKDVLKIFYGQYTNHCEKLSEQECKKRGIINVMAP